MADSIALQMHPDFSGWMREFDLGEGGNTQEGRWAGVAAVIENADRDDVEALIRLAFKTRQSAATKSLQKIRTALHGANPDFQMQGNDRELEVLAGACLVALLDGDGELAAATALAISTASAGSGRKPNLPMDIVGLAETALSDIAESNSRRPDLSRHTSAAVPKLGFEESATKVRGQFDANGVAEAFTLAANSALAAFKTLSQRQSAAISDAEMFITQQDEELQMLWWLVGARSVDLDRSFEAVAAEMQPFLFAKELADYTEFLPGPASIKGLLSRAGIKDQGTVQLQKCVNAANKEWLTKLVEDLDPSPVTQPIHFAIKRQLETGPGDAWVAGWAASTGLDAKLSFAPLSLSNLFYQERLLLLFPGE